MVLCAMCLTHSTPRLHSPYFQHLSMVDGATPGLSSLQGARIPLGLVCKPRARLQRTVGAQAQESSLFSEGPCLGPLGSLEDPAPQTPQAESLCPPPKVQGLVAFPEPLLCTASGLGAPTGKAHLKKPLPVQIAPTKQTGAGDSCAGRPPRAAHVRRD